MSAEDAELDAFLKGDGDLARRLQAMPQASPSAALDAAILGKVRHAMAPAVREAANDPGDAPAPQLARGLGLRWRVPAGIAATVLVGLFARQSFDTSVGNVQVPVMEAKPHAEVKIVAEDVAAPPPPPVPVPAQAEVSAQVAAPSPARPRAAMPRKTQVEQAVAADMTPAPMAAAAPSPRENASNEVSRKAEFAQEPDGASEALAQIERLLAEGDEAAARRSWTTFRERYPNHVVSPDLEVRMKALSR